MFRKVVILSILFQCSSIFALEITKTEKTAQLIHIWGMAKYLHPAASDGKVDMDTEFLELSSKLNAISSAEGVNEFFIKWIDKLNDIDAKYKSNTVNPQEYKKKC